MKKTTKIVILACITILVAQVSLWASTDKKENNNFTLSRNVDIYSSLLKELNAFYVDTIDVEKGMTAGINAMLNSLDPYTTYIPESEKSDFEFMTTGEYGGIGAIIMARDSAVYISEPYEGMPADLAGLKAGDKIISVNGVSAQGKKTADVSAMLKGQSNTTVQLTVQRAGEKKNIECAIMRKKITMNAVPYYEIDNNGIGYILLDQFTDKAATEVKAALIEMKKDPRFKSLILDLRNNPGGIMEEAIEIVNLFVPKGQTVVSTRGKVKQWDRTYKTLHEPIDETLPLVVMVNENAASASEIVAGALQDLDRAVIVGARTYGKGLVQTTRKLPYNAMLKVTTAKYYIPSGRLIQAIDYGKRNADGSVARIPDSLTTVYYTQAGRVVRDGGGIMPDIVAPTENEGGNIVFYLMRDYLLFDYATTYARTHAKIASPKDFILSDADYAAFKAQVTATKFTYDRQTEKMMKEIKKMAEFEGYLQDAKPEFEALEKKLQHNLSKDLETFRPQITTLLQSEIVRRYYYQKGAIASTLQHDKDITLAKELIQDPLQLKTILSAPQKENKKNTTNTQIKK